MRRDVWRRHWRRWSCALIALLGITACGSAGPGGVAVDALSTDVVFGAGQTPAPVAAAPPILQTNNGPSFAGTGSFNPFIPGSLPTSLGTCPTASPTAFPAEPAGPDVTTQPAQGQYRWVGGGHYDLMVLTTPIQDPLPQYFESVVRHIAPLGTSTPPTQQGSNDFTFDTLMPSFGRSNSGYYDFFWQVKSKPSLGDPEGGLSLTEIDTLNYNGQAATPIFKGKPALLLLPLPASAGPVAPQPPQIGGLPIPLPSAPASSTESVDTTGSGNTMQFTGNVGSPEKVDACGTWLDAWPVDGTLKNGAGSATIHLDVATQLGALVIAMNIDGSFLGTTFHNATTRLGQTTPDPIPASLK